MSTRTITGNLAADPEVVKAGSINITKFRVIENTGEYRSGKYVEHDTPTTHFVEAKFELGENTAATLHRGDPVIVIGREHTNSWGPDDNRSYGPRHRRRQRRSRPHPRRGAGPPHHQARRGEVGPP
jgi:single-strand DNA-binding protein